MEKNIQPSNLPNNPVNKPVDKPIEPQRKSGRVKMLLILAVCLTPVLASYFTYYVIKPTARQSIPCPSWVRSIQRAKPSN